MFRLITTQKMKFSIKDFFSKCDQIRRKLQIWSHLLNKSLMENFNFCVVKGNSFQQCAVMAMCCHEIITICYCCLALYLYD